VRQHWQYNAFRAFFPEAAWKDDVAPRPNISAFYEAHDPGYDLESHCRWDGRGGVEGSHRSDLVPDGSERRNIPFLEDNSLRRSFLNLLSMVVSICILKQVALRMKK